MNVNDAVGNLTNVNYSGGKVYTPSLSFAYDPMNRLISMVDAVGTTVYGYDAAGQLLSENGPWTDDTVSYTYRDRLRTSLSIAAPNASAWTQSYGYDTARRLKSVTSPAGEFDYTYDPAKQRELDELTLPGGAYIADTYDPVARLLSTALKNSGNSVLDSEGYSYNLAGQRTEQTFAPGNYMNYTYDNAGELLTAQGHESAGTPRLQEQLGYDYDAAGNLNYRTNNSLIQTFSVNNLNELTTASHAGTLTVAGTTTEPGNKVTSVTVNGLSASEYADGTFASTNQIVTNSWTTYTAIAHDTYGRASSAAVSVLLPLFGHYTYDSNGNLVNEHSPVGGTNRIFSYDDENQLVSVLVTNEWREDFVYDGKMRRRIETNSMWQGGAWVPTNVIYYIYDGNLVVQERDASNLPQVTYTRGNDLSGTLEGAGGIGGLLARTDNSQQLVMSWHRTIGQPYQPPVSFATAFYHADGNGNVTMLIYTNQTIAAHYEYDPYGNTLSLSGPLASANKYRFSSKEWDANSGLYYYLYRFYDPNLQRWPNRDPRGEMGGFNLYRYVNNAPMNWVDSNGLGVNGGQGAGPAGPGGFDDPVWFNPPPGYTNPPIVYMPPPSTLGPGGAGNGCPASITIPPIPLSKWTNNPTATNPPPIVLPFPPPTNNPTPPNPAPMPPTNSPPKK
ncbi:MAG TPA: RHS repeat-associated core domain-containing protein [Verrucomicrobiae bacterium]|nr:RHS repeat-associated core domain-containing protein [Verrucomicrobiae bacterium]